VKQQNQIAKVLVVGFQDELKMNTRDLTRCTDDMCLIELASMDDVFPLVSEDRTITLLIACLNSSRLSDLFHVQNIREQCDHLTLVALFDVHVALDMARRTALGMLSEFITEQSGAAAGMALQQGAAALGWSVPQPEPPEAQGFRLTPRQKDVLYLVREGKSNKEIARRLDLSEGTVKIHCMSVFRTLGVSNRTQAAILAEKFMLVSPEPAPVAKQYQDMSKFAV